MREELLQAASGKKKIAIAGHVRPDGDCVGSCLGAYHFLKKHFPEAEVQVFLEEIPHIFEFLKDWELIKRPGDSDEIYDLFLNPQVQHLFEDLLLRMQIVFFHKRFVRIIHALQY